MLIHWKKYNNLFFSSRNNYLSFKFNYDDLLIGDKNAVLIAARILGYGAEYEINKAHPQTGQKEKVSIDSWYLN